MIQAFLYGLGIAFSFGLANAVTKHLSIRYGALGASVLRNIGIVSVLTCSFLIIRPPSTVDVPWLGIGLGIALASYAGLTCFLFALKYGKVGVVVPISAGSIIISSLIGFVFMGEVVSLIKIATIVIVSMGVVLSSIRFRQFKNSDFFSLSSGVPYALLCACLWGVSLPLFRFPAQHLGSLLYTLIVEVVVLAGASIQLYVFPERTFHFTSKTVMQTITSYDMGAVGIAAFGTALGTLLLCVGFQTGEVSIIASVGGASSMVALLSSAIIYGERLSKQQYVGALMVTVGILLPLMSLI